MLVAYDVALDLVRALHPVVSGRAGRQQQHAQPRRGRSPSWPRSTCSGDSAESGTAPSPARMASTMQLATRRTGGGGWPPRCCPRRLRVVAAGDWHRLAPTWGRCCPSWRSDSAESGSAPSPACMPSTMQLATRRTGGGGCHPRCCPRRLRAVAAGDWHRLAPTWGRCCPRWRSDAPAIPRNRGRLPRRRAWRVRCSWQQAAPAVAAGPHVVALLSAVAKRCPGDSTESWPAPSGCTSGSCDHRAQGANQIQHDVISNQDGSPRRSSLDGERPLPTTSSAGRRPSRPIRARPRDERRRGRVWSSGQPVFAAVAGLTRTWRRSARGRARTGAGRPSRGGRRHRGVSCAVGSASSGGRRARPPAPRRGTIKVALPLAESAATSPIHSGHVLAGIGARSLQTAYTAGASVAA